MAQTLPSVVVLTYMTFTAKRWGQFPTISFTNGAIAGSEVVTVDASLNINIQIQSGVSTMLQVKTAVDATAGALNNLGAGDLVSVTITGGHNGDAAVTVNNAKLVGGTAVASARLTIGHLVYTAVTGGTAGNSIRVKYTSGGSLSVSVASNDITVQLKNDGSSTNKLIKAAITASSPANALVSTASDGLATSFVPTTAMAPAFLSLAGGTAATTATKVSQDLTFTSVATGTSGNSISITYTTGAVAGSEVVTVVGNAITIQISNGVSTATQIKAAFDAAAPATALATCTISGTGSNAQFTVNGAVMTGAVGLNDQGFYSDNGMTVLTASFVQFAYPFISRVITIANDDTSGANKVAFSFDGTNIHGEIPAAQVITWDVTTGKSVWLKYITAAPAYRLIVKGD